MSHEVNRLLGSLYAVPHLVTPQQFNIVEGYLQNRINGKADDDEDDFEEDDDTDDVVDGIGFLSISGPLTYRPVSALCGGNNNNYQSFYERAVHLIESGAKTIVLEVNSGGGEAYACFEYATKVRQLATDNNVTLITYVDQLAASAAYAWAAIGDEIIVNPQAEVGSIGVFVALLDQSEAMKKEGYKRVFVSAGGQKVPFDKDGGFRPEFIEDLQSKVDAVYKTFVDHVAMNLGVSEDLIRKTEAKTFLPDAAMEYGLVDKVMTNFEFADYLKELSIKEEPTLIKKLFNKGGKGDSAMSAATQEEEMDLATLKAEMEALVASHAASLENVQAAAQAQIEKAVARATEAEARLTEYLAQAQAAKMDSRKQAIVDAVGTAKADNLFEATKELSDEAFKTVVSGFKASVEAESTANPFMQEQGVDAVAEAVDSVEESREATILRKKYQQ